MSTPCKLCGRASAIRHTIKNVPYYYCRHCNFLFNLYWKSRDHTPQEQIAANDEAREDRWHDGKPEYMREQGWLAIELMAWLPAWWSRRLHAALKTIPGYNRVVRAYLKKNLPTMLDFGCGTGLSVQQLRAKDNIDIIGLDPFSPTKDPNILRIDLFKAHFPNDTFDGIYAVETMEHIDDVLETFRELHRILRPGRTLLVQTRRLEDAGYQRDQDQWYYVQDPLTHVSLYSRPAMKLIAAKTGFSSVQFKGVRLARFKK